MVEVVGSNPIARSIFLLSGPSAARGGLFGSAARFRHRHKGSFDAQAARHGQFFLHFTGV